MTVAVYIAHAAWSEPRRPLLARLLEQVPRATVVRSDVPEHASVWATRLWRTAERNDASHVAFLNDDVTVPVDFLGACDALIEVEPDNVISLHTTAPEASMMRGRWLRAYWCTGPGYIVPRARLPHLLAFAKEWAHFFTRENQVNEDWLMMQWMWREQTPAYHCVPSLVRHNVSVPSTVPGHDSHPARESDCTWRDGEPLYDADWWRTGYDDAPLVECPWRSMAQLDYCHKHNGVMPTCAVCDTRTRLLEVGRLAICRGCLGQVAARVIGG